MTAPNPPVPAVAEHSSRRWFAMIPMLLGVLVGAITISSAATALPSISAELHLSPVEALWIIDIYPLALAVSLVLAARAGDRFGRRNIMVMGLAGFAVFNVLGGFAPSGLVIIAARLLLGLSEAMVIASVVSTIGFHFKARERVLAYGLWTATFGAGSAFGPLVGGLLSDGLGWRWIMFGAAPIAAVALVLALWLVPESKTSVPPSWDIPSILLSVVGLAGVVYAMQHAALEPLVALVAGVTGLAALTLFVRRQLASSDPLIDVRLFTNVPFSTAYLRIISGGGTSAATVYLVSVHLQEDRGVSAIAAGITIIPHAVMIVIGGLVAPLALRVLSNSAVTGIALLIQAAGLVWLSFDPSTYLGPLLLVGFGMGFVGTLAASELFDVTTVDQAGQVGAIQEVGFALGAGLGVALLGGLAVVFVRDGFTVAMLAGALLVLLAALLPVMWRSPSKSTTAAAAQ